MNNEIKNQFPILKQTPYEKPLIYLDNGATVQKPQRVIDKIVEYYTETNSNIHRGAHYLAEKATIQYEDARQIIANFINADTTEVNFTKGTTESINLVAYTFGQTIQAGDEIIISGLEHHSNIVPWQMVCERVGAVLKVIPFNEKGELDMEVYDSLLSEKTKLVAVNYVSNAVGTINPVKKIITKAHEYGAKVLLDAAQATPHIKIDVQDLDCDFLAFSAHKMYGPTGMGILYGKKEILKTIPPFHGGGEMIKTVSFEGTTYNDLPYKFEAGTPNICGAIAFGEAVNFMQEIGLDEIAAYENQLLSYGTEQLQKIDGLQMIGTAKEKAGVLSFLIEGIHPYDLGVLLDKQGVAIRTGHHCCQPLMNTLQIEGTCRASLAIYNTEEDIDALVKGIERAKRML
ncbi:MAG: aminotransferase class V-fold PLP-dependent enzyme [Chitinophagales bacterium]